MYYLSQAKIRIIYPNSPPTIEATIQLIEAENKDDARLLMEEYLNSQYEVYDEVKYQIWIQDTIRSSKHEN